MRHGTSHVDILFPLHLKFQESVMADKVPRGMSDKGTLRDPSKMVSNNQRWVYAAGVCRFHGLLSHQRP